MISAKKCDGWSSLVMTHNVEMNINSLESPTDRRNSLLIFIHRFVESMFDFLARFRILLNENSFHETIGEPKIYYLFTILMNRSDVSIRKMSAKTEWNGKKMRQSLLAFKMFLFSRADPAQKHDDSFDPFGYSLDTGAPAHINTTPDSPIPGHMFGSVF